MKLHTNGFSASLWLVVLANAAFLLPASAQSEPGKRVSLGTYSLQIYCTGQGGNTTVVETGLGDFLFDWLLVQQQVERTSRICTFDRAGYGSSDMGPLPRTFVQLNLELHELLKRAGEKPPYVLVGQSYGGAVMRNYAARYPDEVAGLVLVESIAEHQPLVFGDQVVLLKNSATGKAIPEPSITANINPIAERPPAATQEPLPEIYLKLPAELQRLQRQFSGSEKLQMTEDSQREWSSEYYKNWDAHPQTGLLGDKPLIVMTRAVAGYDPSPNYSLEKVDGDRLRAQAELLTLSSNSLQIVLPAGHDLHLERPSAVASAISLVVASSASHKALEDAQCAIPVAKLRN